MRVCEVISGLMSLRKEAESHIGDDDDYNDVFYHDIKVIDAAIDLLRKKEKPVKPCKTVCKTCGSNELRKEANYTYCPNCGAIIEHEEEDE